MQTKVQHRKSCPHQSRLHSITTLILLMLRSLVLLRIPVVRVRIDHDDETAETISLDEVAQKHHGSQRPQMSLIHSQHHLPWRFLLQEWLVRFAAQKTLSALQEKRFSFRLPPQRDAVNLPAKLLGIEGTTISIQTEDEVCTVDLSELKKCVIKPVFDFSASAKKQIERIIHGI